MKEVFIAFSPYHVLLALAIASTQTKQAERHVFVFMSFEYVDSIVHLLESLCSPYFHKIYWIPGIYQKTSRLSKAIVFRKNTKAISKFFRNHKVNCIYVSNDEGPEAQAALYLGKSANRDAVGIYFEDGSGAYNSKENKKRSRLQMFIGHFFFGIPWKRISVLGTSPWIDEIHVSFPHLVRAELRTKRLVPISNQSLLSIAGQIPSVECERLFGMAIDELHGVDAILSLANSAYAKDNPEYKKAIRDIVSFAEEYGVRIAAKYHPRELLDDYLSIEHLSGISVLPKALPLEMIYIFSPGNVRLVIGDVSTSLMTAKWLLSDATTVSIAPFLNLIDKQLFEVFKRLDIRIITDISELAVIFNGRLAI